MQINLSYHPADSLWGQNAILSFNHNQASIHLDQQQPDHIVIQQAARKLRGQGINQAVLSGQWNLSQCWAFYQGFYTAKQNWTVEFPTLETGQQELLNRVQCGDFVRSIINLGADKLSPVQLANQAAEFILQCANKAGLAQAVSFEIISGEELERQGYAGIWTVGKGSVNPPAMLQLDFNPTADDNAPILACLVGKGITFDTGGYSLKPNASMNSMKSDMGGAALLTGSLGLAICRGLKQRVKLYLCCAENMVSRNAFKLGDTITYRNGVTIEVMNTDAEGRLVLADGLIDADRQKPQFIIDAATLTGAAKAAVGNDYHSVLSMDDDLVAELLHSAEEEKELFWRLPFAPFHRKQISSAFADISNTGSIPVGAGASMATAFLSYFVEDYQTNWLHFDCSATYYKSANELWAVGATGLGVQTIANLLIKKGA